MARDFRKAYYSQLGVQVVEVKNSLELLLDADPIDIDKLSKFCLHFKIPSVYRLLVWKLLLAYKETWEFANLQMKEQFNDLQRSIRFIYGNNLTSAQDKGEKGGLTSLEIIQMSLVASGLSRWFHREEFQNVDILSLKAIANVFLAESEDETDAFFLTHQFIVSQRLLNTDHSEWESRAYFQINQLSRVLKTHDSDLFENLHAKNVELDEFGIRWFRSYFAENLPPASLERIWDIVIIGSSSVLIFVAFFILLKLKTKLMNMKSGSDIKNFLSSVLDINIDPIVNQAFELWAKNNAVKN